MRVFGLVLLVFLAVLLFPLAPRAADNRPVVAVFDIEDTRQGKAKLSPRKLRSLTDYLASKLAIGGEFKIVPRASVRKAIIAKKRESHKSCYDEACQIEIGKEIAAQKSLATKIDRMGTECIITSTIFDLRQSATENSASYRGSCDRSKFLTAIEQIAAKLRSDGGRRAQKKGIHFDTSDLPAVPSVDMPQKNDAMVSGLDFSELDVEAIEFYDAAVQADKNESVPIEQKIAHWQKVKAPKYRKHAEARIAAWKDYDKKRKLIVVIQKERAVKMRRDWMKLSRLLKLKVISAKDKEAWKSAFYLAYAQETKSNPYANEQAVVDFVAVMGAEKMVDDEGEARRRATADMAQLDWVFSTPAGLSFTRSEVTVVQFRVCVKEGKCGSPRTSKDDKFCNWGHGDRESHPVNCVDLGEASAFCQWAGGRLPTEDEWFAEASNQGSRKYPWGDESPSCERAIWGDDRYTDGCGRDSTWPVCSKSAGNSAGGLCDMAGNVGEWTSSPFDQKKNAQVVRGGAWSSSGTKLLESSRRSRRVSTIKSSNQGFRCVRAGK